MKLRVNQWEDATYTFTQSSFYLCAVLSSIFNFTATYAEPVKDKPIEV